LLEFSLIPSILVNQILIDHPVEENEEDNEELAFGQKQDDTKSKDKCYSIEEDSDNKPENQKDEIEENNKQTEETNNDKDLNENTNDKDQIQDDNDEPSKGINVVTQKGILLFYSR
jgi:hypothetical protein